MNNHRNDEGPLTSVQGSDDPHAVKVTVEQQKFNTNVQGDQPCQQGAQHVIHTLPGLYATHHQGIAAAPDHGIGRGISKKVGPAALGFAATDFAPVGCIHCTMLGQCDQVNC